MGVVVTKLWDLWRYHRARDGTLLKTRSKQELFEPGLRDFALGRFMREAHGRVDLEDDPG